MHEPEPLGLTTSSDRKEGEGLAAASNSPADETPIRFLLVEDNPDHAAIIQRYFRRQASSHELEWVETGDAALEKLENPDEPGPDVVLLDLKLPGMDGHEVLRRIKAQEKLRPRPVIVLSTSDAQSDVDEAYKNYANSYLIKPIDIDRFWGQLDTMVAYWGTWNIFASASVGSQGLPERRDPT